MTTTAIKPTSTDVRALVDDLFAALNAHDVDRIVAMHSKDATFADPTIGEPAKGAEAIAAEFRMMFRAFPDIRFTVHDVYIAESGHVASSWTFKATLTGPIDPPGYAPTGKKVAVRGACFYELKGGKIVRHTSVYDVFGMLQQAGLMPATDSPAIRLTAGLQRLTMRVVGIVRR